MQSRLSRLLLLTLVSVAGGEANRPTARGVARRSLFALTSINPALAVLSNDYDSRRVRSVLGGLRLPFGEPTDTAALTGVLPKLISLALRPRVMFSIGALLRALQLVTPIRWVFDPTCGIGAGINLLCWWSHSEWPAAIVLGWITSPPFWSALGAERPKPLAVPIGQPDGAEGRPAVEGGHRVDLQAVGLTARVKKSSRVE